MEVLAFGAAALIFGLVAKTEPSAKKAAGAPPARPPRKREAGGDAEEQAAGGSSKAPRGEGLGPAANSMMTILRNHQNPKRQNDPNVREQCREALEIYKGLGWQEKASFLTQFGKKRLQEFGLGTRIHSIGRSFG